MNEIKYNCWRCRKLKPQSKLRYVKVITNIVGSEDNIYNWECKNISKCLRK